MRWLVLCFALLGPVGCGGGSGGGSDGFMPAPSNLSYSSPPVFVVGKAIAPLTPSVSGRVSNYSVAPALPKGLTLTTSDGVISGIPAAVAAAATYTVTAKNSSGSTTATISIRVNDIPPAVSYPSTTLTFSTRGSTPIIPSNTGGAVISWSISPALPAGLTLDPTTGSVSSTSTVTVPAAQ